MAALTRTALNGAYVSVFQDLTTGSQQLATPSDTIAVAEGDIIILHNPSGGAVTVGITSVATTVAGRSGTQSDVSDSIGIDEVFVYGPVKNDGWVDGSGNLTITASAGTTVNVSILHT